MAHRLDKHLVSLTEPASFAAEQYQGLRLKIERLSHERGAKVIAVTSPAAGDGKTVTSINLAGALGSGARVLLIDADLRQPAIISRLGVADPGTGLAELLANDSLRLNDAARRFEPFPFDVIPGGKPVGSAHQLLRSTRLEQLLIEARQRYDYIVLDTPPLIPVFDSVLLAPVVDGLLMVVAANRTPRKLLGEALNLLDSSKVLGIVFNSDKRPLFGYYAGRYRRYFLETSGAARHA